MRYSSLIGVGFLAFSFAVGCPPAPNPPSDRVSISNSVDGEPSDTPDVVPDSTPPASEPEPPPATEPPPVTPPGDEPPAAPPTLSGVYIGHPEIRPGQSMEAMIRFDAQAGLVSYSDAHGVFRSLAEVGQTVEVERETDRNRCYADEQVETYTQTVRLDEFTTDGHEARIVVTNFRDWRRSPACPWQPDTNGDGDYDVADRATIEYHLSAVETGAICELTRTFSIIREDVAGQPSELSASGLLDSYTPSLSGTFEADFTADEHISHTHPTVFEETVQVPVHIVARFDELGRLVALTNAATGAIKERRTGLVAGVSEWGQFQNTTDIHWRFGIDALDFQAERYFVGFVDESSYGSLMEGRSAGEERHGTIEITKTGDRVDCRFTRTRREWVCPFRRYDMFLLESNAAFEFTVELTMVAP